jgi:hypothetical protein
VTEKSEVGMNPTTAADPKNTAAAPASGTGFQQS